jgi:para-nitrobenzyl esterase
MHPGASNGIGGDTASIDPADFAASSDVVVVNINRRLGVMGSLAIDELMAENPRMTAGNYGLLDAIESLKWIQANIDEFNGDPNRVMLLGTSSGGILTCLVLGAPDAAGLFDAAAVQSAPCTGRSIQALQASSPHDSRFPPAIQTHRGILTQTGCDVAADVLVCLRAMSAEELVIASGPVELAVTYALFAPLVDGIVVQDAPRDALENQTIGDIPLIVGMASNEVGNTLDGVPIPDDAAYRAWLTAVFSSPLDDAVYALYPTANYPSAKDAYVALIADLGYNCSAEIFALRAMTGAPSYLYEISRGFNDGGQPGSTAFHAIDIPYLFGNFDVYGYTADAQALAIRDAMRNAWASLITDTTSAPSLSDDGTVLWPIFEPVAATYAEFGDTIGGATNHASGRCAALRNVL